LLVLSFTPIVYVQTNILDKIDIPQFVLVKLAEEYRTTPILIINAPPLGYAEGYTVVKIRYSVGITATSYTYEYSRSVGIVAYNGAVKGYFEVRK